MWDLTLPTYNIEPHTNTLTQNTLTHKQSHTNSTQQAYHHSPSSHNQNNLAKKRSWSLKAGSWERRYCWFAANTTNCILMVYNNLKTKRNQSNISSRLSHHRHHHNHFNLHDQHTCDHHRHNHHDYHNHHHLVQAEVTLVSNLTIQDLHLWRKRYCICWRRTLASHSLEIW